MREFWFRFTESNPLVGDEFARSRFADLPGFAADVVTDALGLSEDEWDHLVEAGSVVEVTGLGEYRVPGAVVQVCRSCDGESVAWSNPCGECGGAGELVIVPAGKLHGYDRVVSGRSAEAVAA